MFFAFLFKWAIALTLLYSLYGILLRYETFYRINRFVLLSIIPLSAWLSTIKIETQRATVANRTVEEVTNWISASASTSSAETTAASHSSLQIILIIYYIGLAVVISQYLFALWQVIMLIRQGRTEKDYCINDSVSSPFSWFHWIVISSHDLKENGRVFLAHERAHVHHGHSWDMLLCELCVRLQWFNPFAWMLREDIRAVHEFQADQSVINAGCNVREYNILLIDKAIGSRLAPVANALTQSELKTRIQMMHRRPSPWMATLKVFYVIPFALVTLAIFAKPIAVQNIVNARDAKSILNNLKYVVNLSAEDALPEQIRVAETVSESKGVIKTKDSETSEEVMHETAASTPSDIAARQQHARVEKIKASSDYKRQRAEKSIVDFLQMSINTQKTNTFVAIFADITIDRQGQITRIDLPEEMKAYKWWNPEKTRHILRTVPTELTRDYVNNLDSPTDANILTVELHQYLDQ